MMTRMKTMEEEEESGCRLMSC
ncbi:hypothetical protein LINPERPRIM_LOCUS40699 [Linum perenne]